MLKQKHTKLVFFMLALVVISLLAIPSMYQEGGDVSDVVSEKDTSSNVVHGSPDVSLSDPFIKIFEEVAPHTYEVPKETRQVELQILSVDNTTHNLRVESQVKEIVQPDGTLPLPPLEKGQFLNIIQDKESPKPLTFGAPLSHFNENLIQKEGEAVNKLLIEGRDLKTYIVFSGSGNQSALIGNKYMAKSADLDEAINTQAIVVYSDAAQEAQVNSTTKSVTIDESQETHYPLRALLSTYQDQSTNIEANFEIVSSPELDCSQDKSFIRISSTEVVCLNNTSTDYSNFEPAPTDGYQIIKPGPTSLQTPIIKPTNTPPLIETTPTPLPTKSLNPETSPKVIESAIETESPILKPTLAPTSYPTKDPSHTPSEPLPTSTPKSEQSTTPTIQPSNPDNIKPTESASPIISPNITPSGKSSIALSQSPSPTLSPRISPISSVSQSRSPTLTPSAATSSSPNVSPSASQSTRPSPLPSASLPIMSPSPRASSIIQPSIVPSIPPSQRPSQPSSATPRPSISTSPSSSPSASPSPSNECLPQSVGAEDFECGKECKCYKKLPFTYWPECVEWHPEKFCTGAKKCNNRQCRTAGELCGAQNGLQINEPAVSGFFTHETFWDGPDYRKENENKYCCNNSLVPPNHQDFKKNHKIMEKGTAPISPHNNDVTNYNGNEPGKCAPSCGPNLQNHIISKYNYQEGSSLAPEFTSTQVCSRIACDANGLEKDEPKCDYTKTAYYQYDVCGKYEVIKRANFAWLPIHDNGKKWGKTAFGSMCRFEDGQLNGNRSPTVPSCDKSREGFKISGLPKYSAGDGWIGNFVYEGSGNELEVIDGRLTPKTYHCCQASCEPGPSQYLWFEKPYQGVICDGSEKPIGQCYEVDENYTVIDPACQTKEDSNLSSCPIDYVPPTCDINNPDSCTKCKTCKKDICPECNPNTQKLNKKTGECECLDNIKWSCRNKGGVLDEDCMCKIPQNPEKTTYGFSVGAYTSGISEAESASPQNGNRPMLSDNFFDIIAARRSSQISEYRQNTNQETYERSKGFLFKACPIGHDRSTEAPYSCIPNMSTNCKDGRISLQDRGCDIQCPNPNFPFEKAREHCKCINESCCKEPQQFDPILKICICPQRFLKMLDEKPFCPMETTLNKQDCWCKKNTGTMFVDWEKPECKSGTLDGRTCECVSSPPEPSAEGLKRFNDFSCSYECNGNNSLEEAICKKNGGAYNIETCSCITANRETPTPVESISTSPHLISSLSPSPLPSASPSSSIGSSETPNPIHSMTPSQTLLPNPTASASTSTSPSLSPSLVATPYIGEAPEPTLDVIRINASSEKRRQIQRDIFKSGEIGRLDFTLTKRSAVNIQRDRISIHAKVNEFQCPREISKVSFSRSAKTQLRARIPITQTQFKISFHARLKGKLLGEVNIPLIPEMSKVEMGLSDRVQLLRICKELERF